MNLITGILTYGLFLLASFFYLLYCVSPQNNTRNSIIRFILETLPSKITNIGVALFGQKFRLITNKIINYIFFSNNCLVVIFYLLVCPGSYIVYIKNIFIPYWSQLNIPFSIFTNLCVQIGFWFYYKAYVTEPGIITNQNQQYYFEKYKDYNDEDVYPSDKICRTCKFKKPARSRHCSLCNHCIAKHDHHCIWIQGCVGQKNYKYFVGFLLSHALFTLFGFLISLKVIKIIIKDNDLWNQKFQSKSTGEIYTATYLTLFKYFLQKYNTIIFLCILCIVMAICLFAFTAFHFNLIRNGLTTGEKNKIGKYIDTLRRSFEPIHQDFEKRKFEMNHNELMDVSKSSKKYEEKLSMIDRRYGEPNFWRNLKIILKS